MEIIFCSGLTTSIIEDANSSLLLNLKDKTPLDIDLASKIAPIFIVIYARMKSKAGTEKDFHH
jgi:hypothetical protein